MRRVRVALAQVNPTVGAIEANARLCADRLARARDLGADIVAFPELCLTGYPPEDLLFKPAFIEANLRALADLAVQSRGITAVVGFVDKRDDIYNAAAVLHDGAHVGTYHKQYLPNYGVFDENRYFQAGHAVAGVRARRHGHRRQHLRGHLVPDGPTTLQAPGGAELVVSINASPYHAGKARFRERMLATRAADDLVCLAFVNLVGGQDELVFDGQSFVFDEQGECLARGRAFEEDLVVADVDLDEVFRAGSTTRAGARRSSRGRASANRRDRPAVAAVPASGPALAARSSRPAVPTVDEIYHALVLGTRDYVTKNGFRHVVLGLSGGIDSSLVAAIAVDALGPSNVIGVTMPSPYSSAGTRRDAAPPGAKPRHRVPAPAHQRRDRAYGRALAGPFKGLKPDVTEENLQARIRGNYLMALSNKFGWLVLTTGNKSEIGVGYSTLYGDMAGGFAVIKDVPKTLVYEVSAHVNARAGREIIPALGARARAVRRAPARPDRPGHAAALRRARPDPRSLRRGGPGVAEIVARGFDEATVRRVVAMVDRNEYKRRQGPIGIKITPRAFGKDWRLPIVNRFRE